MPGSDEPFPSIVPKPASPSGGAGSGAAAAPAPQFETAEYKPPAGTDSCKFCGQPIAGQYYRVNGQMSCPSCADKAQREVIPDSHAAFMRALLFGSGAAVVGMIGYATVGIVTGLNIGFASLAVGYIIGKAMMQASKGIGGRRYQLTAVLLTYAAVSVAAVPTGIYYFEKHRPTAQQAQHSTADQQTADTRNGQPKEKMSFSRAIGGLLLLGLASPFLELQDPVHGFIGLIILFVGMRIAWRIARGQPQTLVDGPF